MRSAVGSCGELYGDATNEPRASDLRRQRMADLPVMAEWIDHAAQAPCMRFLHREDLSRTCRQCLREHRIRIRNGKDLGRLHPSVNQHQNHVRFIRSATIG